jgi:hypothetical protein
VHAAFDRVLDALADQLPRWLSTRTSSGATSSPFTSFRSGVASDRVSCCQRLRSSSSPLTAVCSLDVVVPCDISVILPLVGTVSDGAPGYVRRGRNGVVRRRTAIADLIRERGYVAETFCPGRLRPNCFTRHLSFAIPPQASPSTPHENTRPPWSGWSHLVPAITLHNWGRHRLAHPPHAGRGPSRLTAPTTTRSALVHERDRSLAWRPASHVRPRLTVSSAVSLGKARKSAILGDPSDWLTGRDNGLHDFSLEAQAPNHDASLAWQSLSIDHPCPRSSITLLSQHTNARYPGPLQTSLRLKRQSDVSAGGPHRARP